MNSLYRSDIEIVPAAAALMRCEDEVQRWRLASFTIYVNAYGGKTLVRFDVDFTDPSSGEPALCQSIGVFEREFFRKLEEALADAPYRYVP